MSVCTETYLVVDVFDTEKEANSLLNYLKTKFVRFFVFFTTYTQHIAKVTFSFVPVLDFRRSWSEEELNERYGLSEEETSFIDSMIRAMDQGGDD